MKIENTLSFTIILLFSSNIYSYNSNNLCEKLMNNGENLAAIESVSEIKNQYDKNFCLAKAYYREQMYTQSIKAFQESEKHADLPADQMFSILYKGVSERDSGQLKTSTKTLTRGLETAKLGNSKYLEMEHRFLYQLGKSTLAEEAYEDSIDYFSKSIVTAFNDDDRADGYKGLSKAYYGKKKLSKAIEYALKASNMYLKTGDLGEYADLRLNLSSLHLEDGAPNRSLKILIKLEQFAINNGSQYYEAKALLERSAILQTTGEPSKAKDTRDKGRGIANKIGAKDLLLIN